MSSTLFKQFLNIAYIAMSVSSFSSCFEHVNFLNNFIPKLALVQTFTMTLQYLPEFLENNCKDTQKYSYSECWCIEELNL